MFNKICIKDKVTYQSGLDISFLIDSMLYYGKVVLLVHREELKILFQEFGEDTLKELISTGRLELMFRNNILGSLIAPNGNYAITTFKGEKITAHSTLYEMHRTETKNSVKNLKFADEFAHLIPHYEYPDNFPKIIVEEFSDNSLLKKKF